MTESAPRILPKPLRKLILIFGLGLLLLASPIFILLAASGFEPVIEYFGRKPFDSVSWKTSLATPSSNPIRLKMVDDLLRKHPLIGKSRVEVEKLIGIPPPTEYFRSYDLVYWLGPERSFFGIDSEWLGVRFDSNQRVVEATLLRD
jgi:hypothetical protein